MSPELARRAGAEAVGTAFLVAAVIGSGVAAARPSPNDVGVQLLQNSIATGAVLAALIVALQPVSAAFNPIVTLVERAFGAIGNRRAASSPHSSSAACSAQLRRTSCSACPPSASTHHRAGGGVVRGGRRHVGLLLVIFGTVRSGRSDRVAFVVGGYILGAYWFTSSTSFANPAVTIGRMFSNTFAGIAPASARVRRDATRRRRRRPRAHPSALSRPPTTTRHPRGTRGAMTDTPTVLFVCVHNAGRSQMAAGWLSRSRATASSSIRRFRARRSDQPTRRPSDERSRHRHRR